MISACMPHGSTITLLTFKKSPPHQSIELKNEAKKMVGGENGEDCEVNDEAKSFYEKLEKMNESSGLTLVFDFRETMLDLYLFYKEVTQRGGFNQVTTDRKWEEVASSLELKRNDSMLLYQLQKVYQNLLYPYEQIQHYRTPPKAKRSDSSQVKQKSHENVLPQLVASTNELDMPAEKRKRKADSHQHDSTRPGTPEEKKSIKKQPKGKESKKGPVVPLRPRTSYQFFLKAECDRLKKILGERTNYINLRTMASDKWKHFSEIDKQPYNEAHKADKERYLQELVTYSMQQEKQDVSKTATPHSSDCSMLKFSTSSGTEMEYHVKLDPVSGLLVPPPPIEPLIIESAENVKLDSVSRMLVPPLPIGPLIIESAQNVNLEPVSTMLVTPLPTEPLITESAENVKLDPVSSMLVSPLPTEPLISESAENVKLDPVSAANRTIDQ